MVHESCRLGLNAQIEERFHNGRGRVCNWPHEMSTWMISEINEAFTLSLGEASPVNAENDELSLTTWLVWCRKGSRVFQSFHLYPHVLGFVGGSISCCFFVIKKMESMFAVEQNMMHFGFAFQKRLCICATVQCFSLFQFVCTFLALAYVLSS